MCKVGQPRLSLSPLRHLNDYGKLGQIWDMHNQEHGHYYALFTLLVIVLGQGS